MRIPIDLTGQRFGRLTAIRDVGSRRSFRLWLLRCDCGTEIERTSADVRHGKVASCGCWQRELSSERKSLKLVGKIFGRLKVVGRAGTDGHGHVTWNCVCDCGNKKIAAGVSLQKGVTRSCGCLQRETSSARQRAKALPPDQKMASVRANAARQRAKRRTDPIKAMQSRLSRLHRHALAQVNAIKTSPTFEQLGYTAEEFVAHIERQFVPRMGWHNMSDWQIDHIIPVCEAKDLADVLALNQLSNLRPMWAKDNNTKKGKRLSLL